MKTNNPTVPCEECMNSADQSGWTSNGMLITYCEHKKSGGIFFAQHDSWIVFSPIDSESFITAAVANIERLGSPLDKDLVN